MSDFIDLHCHWLPGVDDGVGSVQESASLLKGLVNLGFSQVIATPHMRPGLFDTTANELREVFQNTVGQHAGQLGFPQLELSCEHYFDDVVFDRICRGQGVPYPGGHAVLLEFYHSKFPVSLDRLLAQLKRLGLTPVVAHPERYQAVWESEAHLERLLDLGAVALLDVAALVGKYGRQPQSCAEALLERGFYYAACSDAHHSRDLKAVEDGMNWVRKHRGLEELDALFRTGPQDILGGKTDN